MESYLAHIQRDPSDKIIAVQSVSKHCHNTARYAAAALEPAPSPEELLRQMDELMQGFPKNKEEQED